MGTLSLVPVRLLAALLLAIALVLAALPFAGRASASASPLFISEYVSGSGNNRALEIYNSGPTLDLAAAPHAIEIYLDGAASPAATISLSSGTLAEGGVWVVAHPQADQAILDVADSLHLGAWFDGNDLVLLTRESNPVDRIGQYGVDPGTAWGSGDTSTAGNTLRRQESVTSGDPDAQGPFDPSAEWVGVGLDVFDGLGCWGESACDDSQPPDPESPFSTLRELIATYRDDGTLDGEAADALVKHVDRADSLLTADEAGGAKGQLRALLGQLRGFEHRGLIAPPAAASLAAAAHQVMDGL